MEKNMENDMEATGILYTDLVLWCAFLFRRSLLGYSEPKRAEGL